MAAIYGHVEVVGLLVKEGADVNALDQVTWGTRLHCTAPSIFYTIFTTRLRAAGWARRGRVRAAAEGGGCGGCTLYTMLYSIALRYAALLCTAVR